MESHDTDGEQNPTGDLASPAPEASLVGTWSYPAAEEPSGIGWIHFSDAGRVFQFVYDEKHPERRIPMRLWYSVESKTTLRIRPKTDSDGWICNYDFEDNSLILINPKRRFVCTRAGASQIPQWFEDALRQWVQKP